MANRSQNSKLLQNLQVLEMDLIHGYIPQEDKVSVSHGQINQPQNRMSYIINSQPDMADPITRQPDAYTENSNPSGKWSVQTTKGESNIYSDKAIQEPNKWFVIFKRTVSVIFMLVDIVIAWIQLSEMKAGDDIEFGGKDLELSCPNLRYIFATYIAIMCFSTLYTIAQIVNVIGETIYDVTKGKYGFQFVHGFNEVIIKTATKDIPQLLLMLLAVIFKCKCTSVGKRWFKLIGSYVAAVFSSSFRKGTCKQEKQDKECCESKPCCDCEDCCECKCCKDCCDCKDCCEKCCKGPEECGYTCLCLCCYFIVFSKRLNKRCRPITICEYLGCCENGHFNCGCNPRLQNPTFSKKVLDELISYLSILWVINIITMVFSCDINISLFNFL